MSRYPPPPPISSSVTGRLSHMTTGSSRTNSRDGPSSSSHPARSTRTKPTEPLLDFSELDRRESELRKQKRSKLTVTHSNKSMTKTAEQVALPPSSGGESSERRASPKGESSSSSGIGSKSSKYSKPSATLSTGAFRGNTHTFDDRTGKYGDERSEHTRKPIGDGIGKEPRKSSVSGLSYLSQQTTRQTADETIRPIDRSPSIDSSRARHQTSLQEHTRQPLELASRIPARRPSDLGLSSHASFVSMGGPRIHGDSSGRDRIEIRKMGPYGGHHRLESPPLGSVLFQKPSRSESHRSPSPQESKPEALSEDSISQKKSQQDRFDGSGRRTIDLPGPPSREGSPTRGEGRGEQSCEQTIQESLNILLSKSPFSELLKPITDLMMSMSQETHRRLNSISSSVMLLEKDLNQIKESVMIDKLSPPEVVSRNQKSFSSFSQYYEKTQKTLLSDLSEVKNNSKIHKDIHSEVVELKSDMKSCMLKIESVTSKILPVSFVDLERRMRKCSFLTEEISEKSTKNCEILERELSDINKNSNITDIFLDINEKSEKKFDMIRKDLQEYLNRETRIIVNKLEEESDKNCKKL